MMKLTQFALLIATLILSLWDKVCTGPPPLKKNERSKRIENRDEYFFGDYIPSSRSERSVPYTAIDFEKQCIACLLRVCSITFFQLGITPACDILQTLFSKMTRLNYHGPYSRIILSDTYSKIPR